MIFKRSWIASACLLILLVSSGICRAGESASELWVPNEIELQSLKKIDECIQRRPILEELVRSQAATIEKLQGALSSTEKERDLERRDRELTEKINQILEREIQGLKESFDRMKDIADRSIKLTGDKPVWKEILEWVIRIAIFAAGFMLAK